MAPVSFDGISAFQVLSKRQGGSPMAASTAGQSTAASHTTLYLGIGLGVGCALVIATMFVVVLIVRKRKHHRMSMMELERQAVATTQMEQLQRPLTYQCNRLVPLPMAQSGWDALESNETLNEYTRPAAAMEKRKRERNSSSKKMSLKRLRYLSTVIERPRSESRHSVPGRPHEHVQSDMEPVKASPIIEGTARMATSEPTEKAERRAAPGSPKLDILPSYAIDSPARYGAAVANDNTKLGGWRSVSLGILHADGAVFGPTEDLTLDKHIRPFMHCRSLSLGAPLTRPPSGPVPPLPVISPHTVSNDDCVRRGTRMSRLSSDNTLDSDGSSVLISSPILSRKASEPLNSPTVEELVEKDDRAELKSIANRPRPIPRASPNPSPRQKSKSSTNLRKARISIRGSIMRLSNDSRISAHSASDSSVSSTSLYSHRLSIPQIGMADSISISRVSSSNSMMGGAGRVQEVSTPTKRRSPRRISRMSHVSSNGSPEQRSKKGGVLCEISGNATKTSPPRRATSIATSDSFASSNGNPFHWDASASGFPKHSALKGSPNARQGNKRASCVRISTLTPQVLGPEVADSSSSPATGIAMDNITEERESQERERTERAEVERAVANERGRSRPPMPFRMASAESCLRVQTLRASLTPSSPTLSTWNAFRDGHEIASQPSDSNMSYPRDESRQSNRSSGPLYIPEFPAPSKATASISLTVPGDDAPVPHFSMEMESPTLGFNETNYASQFALDEACEVPAPVSPEDEGPDDESLADVSPVSPMDMPSSPPLPVSKTQEYDPEWPTVELSAPKEEYDPESPPRFWNEAKGVDAERSSGLWLPFATTNYDSQQMSTEDRFERESVSSEEPCSPKTILQDSFPDEEKFTSENASSMLANAPALRSSFLGGSVPVLRPPHADDEDCFLPQWQQPAPAIPPKAPERQRSVSVCLPATSLRAHRPGPPAPSLPTIPQSDDSEPPAMPSPLNIPAAVAAARVSPQGPRSAPARSVLRNVSELRRMNSEVSVTRNRESRNYMRLGREASPLLPWVAASPENNGSESGNELFDFDVAAAERNEYSHTPSNDATTDLDLATMERNVEGALADFRATAQRQRADSDKENNDSRHSSVWDDGEKFWDQHARPESLELPHFQHHLHRRSGGTPRGVEKTVDPRLLSTPDRGSKALGTPRSLYDADGFLRT